MSVARVSDAQVSDEVPDVPVSGCPPPNMSKRAVNLNGSPDSRLRSAALHFVSMPPERFDWSDHPPPQASPSPAGLAPAGLAEAAPPQGGASGGSAPPDLVVRTRRSDHQLKAGTTYRIGRDPKSDIVMTDSRVSWHHGVLRVDGDDWIVEDLGSTNGTFLGLQRVDRIEIGADAWCGWETRTTGRCCAACPRCPRPRPARPPRPRPTTRARALSASPAPPAEPTSRPLRGRTAPAGPRSLVRPPAPEPGPVRRPAARRPGRSPR